MKLNLLYPFLFAGMTLIAVDSAHPQGREWSIVASYTIPGKASGLAWDGTYIYSGLYYTAGDNNLIYKIDPNTGTYTLQCAGPFEQAYGLTFDGTDFWTTDRTGSYTPAIAVAFDYSGNEITTFNLPRTYHSGIAYDNGDFWTCCYYDPDGMVYKLDNAGNILLQFASPNNQPWDICVENDYLWIADYNANMLYRIDKAGNLIESHASAGTSPSGVVYDGQYLWYCDGSLSANSTLYKVDLGGAGTPEINIPIDNHNYGTVTIGDSATWEMNVQNIGDADLEITDVSIPEGEPIHTSFITPQAISPGASLMIPLTYEPIAPGPLETEVTISSNDPINPAVGVQLSGVSVTPGPFIETSDDLHNFGPIRIHAFTRWFLSVYNKGSETLIISDLNLSNASFSIDESVILPLSIGVLDTAKIGIWFNPTDNSSYNDVLQITSNDPIQNPYNVTLEGSGVNASYPIGEPLWHFQINDNYDNSPKAITPISDITGDGVSDVIVCSEDDYVRCFNGNSCGVADVMWEHQVYAGAVYGQNGLIMVPDINDDGYQDVVIGSAWGDRSIIALSGKTGSQIWKHDTHEFGDGGWVYQVDARNDYNDDGVKDILAATGNDGNGTGPIRIFCLNGLNGATIWTCPTGGPNFGVVGVDDFTGDGIPDAVAGASTLDESVGKVYGINGANGSIYWSFTTAGSSVWAVEQLQDINNDGIRDVVAGDFMGNIYYLDATDGSELHSTSLGNVLIIRFEMMDDVNNDGYPDILIAHSGTNAIVKSGLDGSTVWSQTLPDKPWCVSRTNDISGDAVSDALIGTLYSNNYCYFRDGVNGSNLKSINYSEAIDAIHAIPDITGDGSWEMVAGGREGKVYCYSGGLDAYVGVKEQSPIAIPFQVTCQPNPFNSSLTIKFDLRDDGKVRVIITDILGKPIKVLADQRLAKGYHEILWDGSGSGQSKVSPGIYLIHIEDGNSMNTVKVVREL